MIKRITKHWKLVCMIVLLPFNILKAQDFASKHKLQILSRDSFSLVSKNIFLFSSYNQKILREYPKVIVITTLKNSTDTLKLEKIKWNGRCIFKPSSFDTIKAYQFNSFSSKLIFVVLDSNNKWIINDTLKYNEFNLVQKQKGQTFLNGNPQKGIHTAAQISNETRYSTIDYTGQGIPDFYSRTQFNLGVESFGIPVDVSYFITTENNLHQDINNFQLSLNIPKLKENLTKSQKKSFAYESKFDSKIPSKINFDYKNRFLDSLSRSKRDTSLGFDINDSSTKYLKKVEFGNLKVPEIKKDRFSHFDTLLNVKRVSFDTSGLLKKLPLNIDLNFPEEKKLLGLKPQNVKLDKSLLNYKIKNTPLNDLSKSRFGFNEFLMGVENLQVGTYILDLSPIWINISSLKGLNFAYNLNNYHINIFTGTQNSLNVAEGNRLGKRQLHGFRFSRHILNNNLKLYVGYSYGKDSKESIVKNEENSILYYPVTNYVVNGGLNFIFYNQELGIEVSKSNTSIINNSTKYENGQNDILNRFPGSAFNISHKVNLSKFKTQVSNNFTFINSTFNSFGLNFLRKDIARYELKINQTFFNRLNITGTFKSVSSAGSILLNSKFSNQTYILNTGLSFQSWLRRVNVLFMENHYSYKELGDTTFFNKQRLISLTSVWYIPLSKNLKINSIWNLKRQELYVSNVNQIYYSISASNSLKVRNSIWQIDYSDTRLSDTLSQQLGKLVYSYSIKYFKISSGFKQYLSNYKRSNIGLFCQLNCQYKKTSIGARYEVISGEIKMLDNPFPINNGNSITISFVQNL